MAVRFFQDKSAVVEHKIYLCFVSRVTSVAIPWNGDQLLLLS